MLLLINTAGIDMYVDYINSYKSLCTGTLSKNSLPIYQQTNSVLKRIQNCVYLANEGLSSQSHSQNVNGVKISSYRTTMDSQDLQSMDLNCVMSTNTTLGNTDYLHNKKFIKNSIVEDVPMY